MGYIPHMEGVVHPTRLLGWHSQKVSGPSQPYAASPDSSDIKLEGDECVGSSDVSLVPPRVKAIKEALK